VHQQSSFVDKLNSRPRLLYLIIFVVLLIIHLVIFRDVVAAIPSIWSGESTVVREELVPFFDIGKQFFSENTSTLTDSEESRVTYSFWTSWVRQYQVLPIALVLLNTISAFILFHSFYKIGRYFSSRRVLLGIIAAASAAFFIHFILLYSKVTHFYTLIFGFSLFAWSVSLVLEQIFAKRDIHWPRVFATSALALINPAIHYHVIFYLVLAVLTLLHTLFTFVLNRAHFKFYFKRNLIYFLAIVGLSLVPYALFILFAIGDTTSVPVNYWMIYYWSVDLPHLLSFDTASQIDMSRFGSYFAPDPRVNSLIASALIASVFLMKQWRNLVIAKKFFLVSMFVSMLLAIWMSLGYNDNSPYSFHFVLRSVALFLADQANVVADLAGKAIAVFINILRFPHRFQFIYFYLAGVILTVSLLWLKDNLQLKVKKSWIAASIVVLAVPLALFGSRDHIAVAFSGDFAGFLRPYSIPKDLVDIKDALAHSKSNKLFIMPTLESGREIVKDNASYSFIDKFLIYYLDQPTVYYGTAGDPRNKLVSYLVYQSVDNENSAWESLLTNNMGITHILVPKKLLDRHLGLTYMPGVEDEIADSLQGSKVFKRVYEGDDFDLYTASQRPNNKPPVLVDMYWDKLVEYLQSKDAVDSKIYLPLQIDKLSRQNHKTQLVTDNVERSFYDLYNAWSARYEFQPDNNRMIFDRDIIASSDFTNNALSLNTLDSKDNDYNSFGERVPSLVSLHTAKFAGLGKFAAKMDLNITVPEDGTYRVLLHAASKDDTITGVMGGQKIVFQKIQTDRGKTGDYIDFSYYYTDLDLVKGKPRLAVQNQDDHAVLVESGLLMPQKDIPPSIEGTNGRITITPTKTEGRYDITLTGEPL
jgi:hypothetical protein